LSRGTKGSHPPSLLRIVERTLREECRLSVGDCLLLAVSGGGDSMAMLHVLGRLAPRFGIRLFAHGVDHGLRAEAGRELDLAASLASQLGIEFSRSTVSMEHGANLQSRARGLRYQALNHRAAAVGAALVATAHHADDRAETVILRLLRGAGLHGLGVLPARRDHLVRPLVRARRADILAHLQRHEVVFASDPSNQNTHYLRVKVRLEILPVLAAVAPRIVDELCAIADEAARLRDAPESDMQHGIGRRQRDALMRALASGEPGFELPLRNGLVVRIERRSSRASTLDPTDTLEPAS
jgi:tRNA(Ile)-lysidine synthase